MDPWECSRRELREAGRRMGLTSYDMEGLSREELSALAQEAMSLGYGGFGLGLGNRCTSLATMTDRCSDAEYTAIWNTISASNPNVLPAAMPASRAEKYWQLMEAKKKLRQTCYPGNEAYCDQPTNIRNIDNVIGTALRAQGLDLNLDTLYKAHLVDLQRMMALWNRSAQVETKYIMGLPYGSYAGFANLANRTGPAPAAGWVGGPQVAGAAQQNAPGANNALPPLPAYRHNTPGGPVGIPGQFVEWQHGNGAAAVAAGGAGQYPGQ